MEIDGISLYADISNQLTVLYTVVDFLAGWTQMFIQLSLILFAVSCYAAAVTLDSIQREINRFDLVKMTPLLALNRLKKWKRCHALVSEIFDSIEDCFSPTLFLSVIFLLIRFIDQFIFSDCLCLQFATIADVAYSFFSYNYPIYKFTFSNCYLSSKTCYYSY